MIRSASNADKATIIDLAREFDRFGPYVPVFEAMVERNHGLLRAYGVHGDLTILVHEDLAGSCIGFVAVEWEPGVGHIHGVAVTRGSRSRGVASSLLDEVARAARQRGIPTLDCITAETENEAALRCFLRLGFRNLGYKGRYPMGQRAVRLERTLEVT
jgi:ribosomal protein S18 acetylase RimI-like enzyme